jgi:acetolactate synthase-1/2/3 large subunit
MIKVSDLISEFLVKNKIEIVFGIIGSANSYIFNSIHENTNIKLVTVHHEQAAVMAMGAYYRATGKMSVALVTAGGGSSNAFTGILSNWADSIPGIIFSGQEQTHYLEDYKDMRMYGIQGYDSVSTFSKCTKLSALIDTENVYDVLQESINITQTGRPGPVFLEVPFDTQGKMIELKEIPIYNQSNEVVESSDLDHIIKKLNESKRPVIIGGHGVKLSHSEDLFKEFVESHDLPTILSWSAIDLLPHTHKNNFGRSGVQGQRSSNFIIQNCDLLIVLGSRLSILQTGYSLKDFAPNAHIIHIDIDPSETNKVKGKIINKDVNLVLSDLIMKKSEISVNAESWISYCDYTREKYPLLLDEHITDPTSSYTFIDRFSESLEDNHVIVTDMGTALLSGFYGFKLKENQKMFTSLGLGEMGYGIAAAVGAGFGDKPVICLNCDGGMMMNLQELQTIKNYNLPVKIVIFNNDGYLMIKHTQKMLFNGKYTCVNKETGVELPDYQKVAEAFNYDYFREDKLEDFFKFEGQAILEVFMDHEQEFIPKVKGMKSNDNKIQAGLLEEMSPILPYEQVVESMITGLHERSKTMLR